MQETLSSHGKFAISIQWMARQKYCVYLVRPAFGKLFLILRERFLLHFLLLKVFLTFMKFSLLSESFGRRPLGCAVKDLMPDFLREMAVGCTLILARLCKIGR